MTTLHAQSVVHYPHTHNAEVVAQARKVLAGVKCGGEKMDNIAKQLAED